MHQLSSLYILNYVASHLHIVRERAVDNMQRTVFTLARLNSSYHQELVSHPMSENVDELSSSVRIKFQHLSLVAMTHATQVACGSTDFFPLVFEATAIFFTVDNHF